MREGWTYKELGDCLSYIKNGANIKQTKDATGIPITRIETLSGGVFNRDRLGYANVFSSERYSQYIMEDGDILMSHINSKAYIGRSVLYRKKDDEQIIHGMNLLRLKVVPSISSSYLNYAFKSDNFRDNVAKIRKDAVNQSSMAISDLIRIPIPVPPLSEQQRIVSELDLLSSIIEKKKAQLKEYDQLAQSIFYDMFGDPMTNEKGWKLKKMGEVCAQKSKIARASKKFTSNSPIEYIDISSVDNISKTITTTTSYIFSEAPSRAQQIVEYGDILISLVRPNLQNIAIVLYNKNNLVGSSGFCVIRTEQQTIKEYLFYVIRSSHFTDFLMQRVSGANYPAVREEDVKSFTLPIPPLSLQQQFASKIEAIEKQKELIKQSITETETLFNSRMDYYFN